MYSFAHVTNISGSGHEDNFCNCFRKVDNIFCVYGYSLYLCNN